MSFVIADRVRETAQVAGTGAAFFLGPPAGYLPFSTIGDGNSTYYVISFGSQWEVGIGTYTASTNSLARDTVLSSSNGGLLVNFASGLKDIILSQPAERAVYVDGTSVAAANNATIPNSLLANSSITLNGAPVPLGGSATIAGVSTNTPNTLVQRDASGNFSAGTITASLSGNATTSTTSSNLAGGVAGAIPYQSGSGATAFSAAGTSGQVLTSNGTAAPTWTTPATVNNGTLTMSVAGTGLSGSSTFTANQSGNSTFTVTSNATNLNNPSTLVARDASGNFSAGTITATLSGNASTATSATSATNATNTTNVVSGGTVASNVTGSTQAEKTADTTLATTAFVDRLRSLTSPSTSSAGGTLVIGDRGALVSVTAGVTVPASVFGAQDAVTVYNNTAGNITITQGTGLTMYQVGTATTGNRTLAQRGLVTIVFIDATNCVISGGGLT